MHKTGEEVLVSALITGYDGRIMNEDKEEEQRGAA